MLARGKLASLAELFSVKLKFTIDVLNDWFSNTVKPNFFELNDIEKQIYTNENWIIPTKTTCLTCGFLSDVQEEGEHKRGHDVQEEGEHKRGHDFIVECEYLFLRNIYSNGDLKKIGVEDIQKYY